MAFWNTKEEKNYGNEIVLLTERQKELDVKTEKNSSEMMALGIDFKNYKSDVNEKFRTLVERLLESESSNKAINKKIEQLEKELQSYKNQKDDIDQETTDLNKAKKELPETLSCDDICEELRIPYLKDTILRYYFYECGLLDLKINKFRNTYKVPKNILERECEYAKYTHVTGSILTFDRAIIEVLTKHLEDIKESIGRYARRLKQFNDSKENLNAIQLTNYQKEIGNICGIGDEYQKNKWKWKSIYDRYAINHPKYRKEYDLYTEKYLEEHPSYNKPSVLSYLIKECGDGDVLLKIACELFVN